MHWPIIAGRGSGVVAGLLPFLATALLGSTGNHVSTPATIVAAVATASALAAWRVQSSIAPPEPSAIAIGNIARISDLVRGVGPRIVIGLGAIHRQMSSALIDRPYD